MDRILNTREWLEAGIHVATGSEAPSMPAYNPQATLAGSMSRHALKENAISPDQVLTFEETLWAHTF